MYREVSEESQRTFSEIHECLEAFSITVSDEESVLGIHESRCFGMKKVTGQEEIVSPCMAFVTELSKTRVFGEGAYGCQLRSIS